MDADSLFIKTLEDLHRSVNSPDEYEVLRASHLIRQLLLDGAKSLVDRVNRSHRRKIEYFVSEVPPLPPFLSTSADVTWFAVDGISPHMGRPGSVPVALQWDRFQKMIVAKSRGYDFTVHDIIDHLAHIGGGVHMGSPRTEKEQALAVLNAQMPIVNLNMIVQTLRAVGRIILDGLCDLKEQVLGVGQFEDGPGISIYTALTLAPMTGGHENYLFDVGIEDNRNRVSIFIDAHGELCVRIFSALGRMFMLRVGSAGAAFRYDEHMYLCCEVGTKNNAILLNIDSAKWSVTRVYRLSEGLGFVEPIHTVIGSDVSGRCQANMRNMELVIVHRIPSNENRVKIREYLARRIHEGYSHAIEYEPGACLYSIGHPRFPQTVASGNGLVSSGLIQPRFRILKKETSPG